MADLAGATACFADEQPAALAPSVAPGVANAMVGAVGVEGHVSDGY
jgi:hypothetical protein